jgi:fatty acid synthase subunit alpha
MRDIEITNDESGVPTVQLHGDAMTMAEDRGISKIIISLSHSDVSSSLPRPSYLC